MVKKRRVAKGPVYQAGDSWAYWQYEPQLAGVTDLAVVEQQFTTQYQPGFPQELPEMTVAQLDQQLKLVNFVIVGAAQPATSKVTTPQPFQNFHGPLAQRDCRLAAALFQTPVWGAFMTVLPASDRTAKGQPRSTAADVQHLVAHLAALGIPETAALITIGKGSTYQALKKYLPARRQLEEIMAYASTNSHWQITEVHEKIQRIVQRHLF